MYSLVTGVNFWINTTINGFEGYNVALAFKKSG